jgi:phage baseplate assembly protein W
MQPFLGSGLTELLFEQTGEQLEERIETTVTKALQDWLPYVIIDSIIIQQTNELRDRNRVEVSMKFRIDGTPTLETVTFNVDQ